MRDVLSEMYETILMRKTHREEGSYTSYLFDKGKEKILKKVGEESTEVVIAAMADDHDGLVEELNDLAYHLLVLMAETGVTPEEFAAVAEKRAEKTHNLKPERKPIENL